MSPRIRHAGGEVVKRFADPAATALALGRTNALRAAGVTTPPARAMHEPTELAFAEVRGTCGLRLLVEEGVATLPLFLSPLAVLHTAALPDLSEFDPLRRITPRLGPDTPGWIGRAISTCLCAATGGAAVTLHGDFHAGQLIRDSAGTVWLLDLDDLAAGPAEADLGNFAAHLATRPETRRGPARAGFEAWLVDVLAAWPGTARPDAARARALGRIALIRRAMKAAEAGDTQILGDLAADLPP